MAIHNEVNRLHPCFSGGCGAKGSRGRLHLPVAGRCNIKCRFCERAFNRDENRPGVSARILEPADAAAIVGRALELCPEITVAGIAGPGDALASDSAVKTFEAIDGFGLIKCMSTNGLLLPEYAERLEAAKVTALTVTVNAVREDILDGIVSSVSYGGKVYSGAEGAKILIKNQIDGIRAASRFAVVKVNTVLIPGKNDGHIKDIARAAAEAGASMINIIPLIPAGEFKNTIPPDCGMLQKARADAENFLPVFRNCMRCRADACGIPGVSEFSDKLYADGEYETFSHG